MIVMALVRPYPVGVVTEVHAAHSAVVVQIRQFTPGPRQRFNVSPVQRVAGSVVRDRYTVIRRKMIAPRAVAIGVEYAGHFCIADKRKQMPRRCIGNVRPNMFALDITAVIVCVKVSVAACIVVFTNKLIQIVVANTMSNDSLYYPLIFRMKVSNKLYIKVTILTSFRFLLLNFCFKHFLIS